MRQVSWGWCSSLVGCAERRRKALSCRLAGDSPACQESEEDREAVLTELRTWWWSVKSGQVRSMWHSCMSWMQALIPSSCLYNGGLHWPMAVLPCVSCLSRTCSAQGHLSRRLYSASRGDCQKCANIYTYTRRLAKINNTTVMVRRAQRRQHYRLRPEREGWVWGPSQPGATTCKATVTQPPRLPLSIVKL